ncbi:MAG: hypothetical protein KKD39_08545, partial [Candidatus Altiarchaeota archaeon]|nr:hypothetical protein [Candidatus Altiarchaeota archaeon]
AYSWLILDRVKSLFFTSEYSNVFFLSLMVLAFGSTLPFILVHGNFYELSISSKSFFLIGGVYYLLNALVFSNQEGSQRLNLALAGTFFGLALFSKANCIFVVILLSLYLLYCLARTYQNDKNRRWFLLTNLLHYCIPLFSIMALMFLYNYLRFDNFLEFGLKYVLLGVKQRGLFMGGYVPFSDVPSIFYDYFFRPPIIDFNFPYYHLEPESIGDWYGRELIVGVFFLIPYLILPLIFISICLPFTRGILYFKIFNKNKHSLRHVIIVLGFSILGNVIMLVYFPLITIRYLLDFALFSTILASYAIFMVLSFLEKTKLPHREMIKKSLTALIVLLAVLSILFNIFPAIFGYYGFFRNTNPTIYNSLKTSIECGVVGQNCFNFYSGNGKFQKNINDLIPNYNIFGFYGAEGDRNWCMENATVFIHTKDHSSDLRFTIEAGHGRRANVTVIVNNVERHEFYPAPEVLVFNSSKETVKDFIKLDFKINPTFNPSKMYPGNQDKRDLGLYFRNITIEEI